MKRIRKVKSIYTKLILLLIAATVVSILAFGIFVTSLTVVADKYYASSKVTERLQLKYTRDLQKYVTENQVRSDDQNGINAWLYDYGIQSMLVVKDGQVTYNAGQSTGGDPAILAQKGIAPQKITFADGEADVYFEGMYSYGAFTMLIVFSLLFSFAVFLLIVLTGVRQKIKRIQKMEREVEILSSGNLDYEITVHGNDEIENLSRGIDDMRCALKEQFAKEQKIMQNSRDLVTEISHDLRTPLTSILLYSEMLRKNTYRDEAQQQVYIERISVKANQLKVLTDDLFEFALVGQDQQVDIETDGFQNIFYDQLSSMVNYLVGNGFEFNGDPEWRNLPIQYNQDYLNRIFDNVASNILKYADRSNPILFRTRYDAEHSSLVFQNRVATELYVKDRNHIGLKNINKMMEAMGGACDVTRSQPFEDDPTIEDFTIALRFRNAMTTLKIEGK